MSILIPISIPIPIPALIILLITYTNTDTGINDSISLDANAHAQAKKWTVQAEYMGPRIWIPKVRQGAGQAGFQGPAYPDTWAQSEPVSRTSWIHGPAYLDTLAQSGTRVSGYMGSKWANGPSKLYAWARVSG